MSRFVTLHYDLIDELQKQTLWNDYFDKTQWSERDAEILIQVGRFIKRELGVNDDK